MTRYDIIGDIHGCAPELKSLLAELGYEPDSTGVHRHPDRTAVFVGDLVDRKEGQREVLQTVKAMVDAGSALIVMGNHEFNAVCYATPDPRNPSDFLRTHIDEKNTEHHIEFLKLDPSEREHYIEWFKTLPLWLELTRPDGQTLRVVHACWHEPSMEVVKKHCNGSDQLLTVENFAEASLKDSALYQAVEILLKGPEINIAERGHDPYYDHGGKKRESARIRWWDQNARTLGDIADVRGMKTKLKDGKDYPPLPDDEVKDFDFSLIYTDPVPVVYGHYWFDWDSHRENCTEYTACVDFGAVTERGRLVAYRWDGQPTITWENYVPHTSDVVA
ncbi:MAG: metallophosphoesterase, partial [Actinomycetes bacterium]